MSQPDRKAQTKILKTLRKRKQRALHASEIRGRIGLDRSRHDEVLRLLADLTEQGLLAKLPGDRYQFREQEQPERGFPEASEQGDGRGRAGSRRPGADGAGLKRGTLEGVLSMNARGFGFVVTPGDAPDVFIPPGFMSGAMHGDRVRVRARPSPKGLDGRVAEVLERSMQYVGGQLHLSAEEAYIEPDDERVRNPIRIKGKLPPQARTGLGVIAKIVSYPENDRDALGVRIVETFEPEAFVQYEIRRILLRENASEEFPADVQAEAAELPKAIAVRDRRGREDLRQLPLLTIDPADARDHDDAVWAERLAGGGYRAIVAIADVSHYVREGSALDREAIERGCTIYLPSRAIPMLPPELSSNLASLLPKRDRLTLAVEIELDAAGNVERHRFIEGVMRSAASLTYEQVAQALGLTVLDSADSPAQAHIAELAVLLEVAKLLRERRRARGSLEFELPEAKVRVEDETGLPIDVERSRKDPGVARAYNMIEELMLLANEVVAQDLTERGVPTIYRVHPAPDPERIETFCALAKALGFDIAADVAEHPVKLARFLTSIHGTPHATALGYLLLRSMQQATYDTENVGHFGLAAEHYLHFTSPIRRYPDLAVHRVVRAVARGERVESWGLSQRLKLQAGQSSQRERRAMSIEREVVDLYGAYLMRDQVGETFDATISGLSDHGFYATLDAPFVDVLCRVTTLPPDRYELDAHGVRLRGLHRGRSYALGDRVRLRIEDVSIAQRKVLAAPAEVPSVVPAAPRHDERRSARPPRRRQEEPRERSQRGGAGAARGPKRTQAQRGPRGKRRTKR